MGPRGREVSLYLLGWNLSLWSLGFALVESASKEATGGFGSATLSIGLLRVGSRCSQLPKPEEPEGGMEEGLLHTVDGEKLCK